MIVDIVKYGLKIDFKNKPKHVNVREVPHNAQEKSINLGINKLLQERVITIFEKEQDDFISTVFTREKKDGTFQTILNLRYLNEFVEYKHFKMGSLEDVFKIIKKDAWMASADIKDLFFTIPVHILHQKYFKFEWFRQLYMFFLGMLNEYSDAMRIFTKMFKPVFGYLRQQGHLSVVFVDNSYLQTNIEQECIRNRNVIVDILTMLGFAIHESKSVLIPTQKIEFLGFLIDLKNMTISIS